jgi:outer membrane protein assembly factor BamB
MPNAQPGTSAPLKPLRVWPGVIAVGLQWAAWVGVPLVAPAAAGPAMLVGLACGVVVLVWWLFFSRAPWVERVAAIVLMVVAVAATRRVVHESMATGMMGLLVAIYAIPALSLALVAGAFVGRRLPSGPRRASIAGAILLACGALTLLRTGGMTGDADSDFAWRWSKTPEERLLALAVDAAPLEPAPAAATPTPAAMAGEAPVAPTPAPPVAATPAQAIAEPAAPAADPEGSKENAEWPGFRGPARDGVIRGSQIAADWSRSVPVELWRQPIGPGWSSFAVHGGLIYTQEQRGDDEMVSAYSLATGAPVWRHRDAVRFYESNGGAGPRGTPAYSHGRVYALGATGILNALDARDGAVVWSRNAASDTGTEIPGWGFASSPLVTGDVVVVATEGVLAAYDAGTGAPRWIGPAGRGGYSSPQLVVIDGVAQVILLNGEGATGVAPADGRVLWTHAWPGDGIVQPAVIAPGDVLIGSGSGLAAVGVRRLAIVQGLGGWTVAERWTSAGLKPYFNDFVVHKGHAFGFDGSILACIDVTDGTRKWKGGRYGHGQLVALPDQDVLLVLSEEGELALVAASTDRFAELARFPAIDGKTWNHPVLVGDVVLVRNGEEMAAFRLPLAGR